MQPVEAFQCDGCGKVMLAAEVSYHNEAKCIEKREQQVREYQEYHAEVEEATRKGVAAAREHAKTILQLESAGGELVERCIEALYDRVVGRDFNCCNTMQGIYDAMLEAAKE